MCIKISFEATTPEQLRGVLQDFLHTLGESAARCATLTNEAGTAADVYVVPETQAPEANVVSDLTPEGAREQAIKAMQNYFADNPDAMTQVAVLQKKYGIKMFSEISDDKAHDLLADVLLIANGTPAGEA